MTRTKQQLRSDARAGSEAEHLERPGHDHDFEPAVVDLCGRGHDHLAAAGDVPGRFRSPASYARVPVIG